VFFSRTVDFWPFPLRPRDSAPRPTARRRPLLHGASRTQFLVPGPISFTQPHRVGSFSLPQCRPTVGIENFQFGHGLVAMGDSASPFTLRRTSHTRNLTNHPSYYAHPHHPSWFSLPHHKNQREITNFHFSPAAADLRQLSPARDALSLDLTLYFTLTTATTQSAPSDRWIQLSEHALPGCEHIFLTSNSHQRLSAPKDFRTPPSDPAHSSDALNSSINHSGSVIMVYSHSTTTRHIRQSPFFTHMWPPAD
jgi:hypothetical protein